jgi:hypothetical protein
MQYAPLLTTQPPQAPNRPSLRSFDSSRQCSVEYWREVYGLLEPEEDDLTGYLFEDTCFVGSR